MKVHLVVSSDCDDTSFYVRASVSKADGKWYTLRDDIEAISWNHPSYVPGTEVALDYTLSDHAFKIARGERLRLDVAGACANQFVPHTNFRGAFNVQARTRVSHSTVRSNLSFVMLPVLSK